MEMPFHISMFITISEMALTALLVPGNRNVPGQPKGHSDMTLSVVDLRNLLLRYVMFFFSKLFLSKLG
jgi:hypothetical protein